MGTNYFVDNTIGDDTDSGETMNSGTGGGTGCWATIEHAHEAGGLVAGDRVWVRRIQTEIPASCITVIYNGTAKDPIYTIGWPRTTHSIVSADFTNGSTSVNVNDNDMDREKHCARYLTAPDGHKYVITRVTTSGTVVIDREYAGTTVSGQGATISADEDYALAQAIDDSGWSITKADWNADADDLACIDFNEQDFYIYSNGRRYLWFANIELKDGAQMITFRDGPVGNVFVGCLVHLARNRTIMYIYNRAHISFKRCVITGSGDHAGQRGLIAYQCFVNFIDSAIYNCGCDGIYGYEFNIYAENFNIGVEQPNVANDIFFINDAIIWGRDVKCGGTISNAGSICSTGCRLHVENWGKVLGAHKSYSAQGEITKAAADGSGTCPQQRSGGSANVIEILHDESSTANAIPEPVAMLAPAIFSNEFEADTTQCSYRYYVQSMAVLTASQLWIELEYVSLYDDDTEYVFTKVVSDEAVAARSNQSDWSQYIEVLSIQPAVTSKVRIKCYCSYQHAENKIYIDPKVVIS